MVTYFPQASEEPLDEYPVQISQAWLKCVKSQSGNDAWTDRWTDAPILTLKLGQGDPVSTGML